MSASDEERYSTIFASLKTFVPLFLSLLLLSSLLVTVPVCSEVVHPYDWVKVGAYAKYIWPGGLRVRFPNGTLVWFDINTPSFLEWSVGEKRGDTVGLNVTLFTNGMATISPPGITSNVTYLKPCFSTLT